MIACFVRKHKTTSTALFTAFMLFACLVNLYAQPKGEAQFDHLSYTFGRLSPKSLPVKHKFQFINKGRAAIRILKVQPSCECTASDWTISPIAVKDTGMVEVTFDPSTIQGEFTKHVTVLTDGYPQAILLKIKGEVVTPQAEVVAKPAPKKVEVADIERWYPKKAGSLRLSATSLFFGDVLKESTATQQLTLYNPTDRAIQILPEESKLPLHVTWNVEGNTVRPKDSLQILLTFHEKRRKDWGYVHSNLFLATTDTSEPRKRIDLSARIVEDFGDWEANDPRAIAVLDKSKHDFGSLGQNSTVSTTFTLSNHGKEPLYIRKTKASCGCTASEPAKRVLAPGESTPVQVTFRSGNEVGYQKKSVTIITNDPERTEMVIWIDAHVH